MYLLNIAASLMDGGDDIHILEDGHGNMLALSSEYLRGQIELIVDAFGLTLDGGHEIVLYEIERRLEATKVIRHTDAAAFDAAASLAACNENER